MTGLTSRNNKPPLEPARGADIFVEPFKEPTEVYKYT